MEAVKVVDAANVAKTKGRVWTAALLAMVLAGGCTMNRFKSDAHVDTEYDFSRVDSFAFQPLRKKTLESQSGKILQELLREELTSRGYAEVEPERASVLISFDIGQYAPAKLSGSNNFAVTEGTLTVTVLDPATRRTVWYGWVEVTLRPDDDESLIADAVDALFEGRIPDAPAGS